MHSLPKLAPNNASTKPNGRALKHNSQKSFDEQHFERSKSISKKGAAARNSMRRNFSLQTTSLDPMASDGLAEVVGGEETANAADLSCNCLNHVGKECLNKIFNLNIDYLFDCLFEKNDFDNRFAQLTKKFGKN